MSEHDRQRCAQPWSGPGPAAAALALRDRPHLVWLDSALAHHDRGRWSIVASDPRWTFTTRGRRLSRVQQPGQCHDPARARREWSGDPLDALEGLIARETGPEPPAPILVEGEALPFVGGALGYLSFELGRQIERLPARVRDDLGVPDIAMGWYDAALVWDGKRDRGWLVGTSEGVRELWSRLEAGLARRPAGRAREAESSECAGTPARPRANLKPAAYIEAVERARAYIAAGDIYQVNLSQRFSTPLHEDALDVYRRLRRVSPAPFAAFLRLGGVEVLSSSPERLLLADGMKAGDRLETRPIKGTRPRDADPPEDARLAAELRASAKDRAEHVMIVDLERNDLGRVAEVGSVRVEAHATLESFAQVHHLTSTIAARLRAGVGLATLLRATFPGGSISGAPKIRALEVIDELEPTARGIYTGAIGYISAHGRMDLNVAIRTLTVRDGLAHLQVGGAIVHDSRPLDEYRETLDKARGMARALRVTLPDEAPAAGAVLSPIVAG